VKLNHVNLPVADVSATRDFFEKHFGFRPVETVAIAQASANNLMVAVRRLFPGASSRRRMPNETIDRFRRKQIWSFYFRSMGTGGGGRCCRCRQDQRLAKGEGANRLIERTKAFFGLPSPSATRSRRLTRRVEMLAKRHKLMADWETFCSA
jgi:catechol 2,3-dioxygenase-like lactoylglutathione lyase family enzyme